MTDRDRQILIDNGIDPDILEWKGSIEPNKWFLKGPGAWIFGHGGDLLISSLRHIKHQTQKSLNTCNHDEAGRTGTTSHTT